MSQAAGRNEVQVGLKGGGTFPLAGLPTGALIVGVIDLAYAIVVYSPGRPILVPQTIASGILGRDSYTGGLGTAALGVLLHFVIAFGATLVYYVASQLLPVLRERPVLCGFIYGGLVYCFMHTAVVPFSNVPHHVTPLGYRVAEFFEHCVGVGWPISWSLRHFSRS